MPDEVKVIHQVIEVELDLCSETLRGFTELEISSPPSGTNFLALHSHGLTVSSIQVNGFPVANPNFDIIPVKETGFLTAKTKDKKHRDAVKELADFIYNGLRETLDQEGRANLQIPLTEDVAAEPPAAAEAAPAKAAQAPDKAVWHVRLDFSVSGREAAAAAGVRFWGEWAHCTAQPGSGRTWFPCVWGRQSCSTFTLRVSVPFRLIAVCSGQLKRQVWTNDGATRKLEYDVSVPVLPSQVAMAVGDLTPFPCYWPPKAEGGARNEGLQDLELRKANQRSNTCITHLVPPGCRPAAEATLGFFHLPFQLFEKHFGSADLPFDFPFPALNLAVLPAEALTLPAVPCANALILSTENLVDKRVFEQGVEARLRIVECLAAQWFGVFMIPHEPSDQWLINGLAGYLTALYIRKCMGFNELAYRRYREQQAIVYLDDGLAPPLCPRVAGPKGGGTLGSEAEWPRGCAMPGGGLSKWKAAAVIGMIERRVGEDNFRKFISKKIQNAMPNAPEDRTISTHTFLRSLAKQSGLKKGEIDAFAERWVYGRGCPSIFLSVDYSRKKNSLEIALEQLGNSSSFASAASSAKICSKDGNGIGVIRVCVSEADGDSEHSMYLGAELYALQEIKCGSKPGARSKGTGGGRAQRGAKDADGPSAGDGAEGGGGRSSSLPPGLAAMLARSPLNWVVVDPGQEWLCEVKLHLPEAVHCCALTESRSVTVQALAASSLAPDPSTDRAAASATSDEALQVLANCLGNRSTFCRVRADAAETLAKLCHGKDSAMRREPLEHLMTYLRSRLLDEETGTMQQLQFPDLSELVVIQAALSAIAMVQGPRGNTPAEVVSLLLQVLEESDASNADVDDGNLRAYAAKALGECCFTRHRPDPNAEHVSSDDEDDEDSPSQLALRAVGTLERQICYDRHVPSFGNIVSAASIEALAQLAAMHRWGKALDSHVDRLAAMLAAPGNSLQLRRAAHKAAVILKTAADGPNAALMAAMEVCSDTSLPEQLRAGLLEDLIVELPQTGRISWRHDEPAKRIRPELVLRLSELAVGPRAASSTRCRYLAFVLSQLIAGFAPTVYRASDEDSLQSRRGAGRTTSGAPAASGYSLEAPTGAARSTAVPGRSARTGGTAARAAEEASEGGRRNMFRIKLAVGGEAAEPSQGRPPIAFPSRSRHSRQAAPEGDAENETSAPTGLRVKLTPSTGSQGKPAQPGPPSPDQEVAGSPRANAPRSLKLRLGTNAQAPSGTKRKRSSHVEDGGDEDTSADAEEDMPLNIKKAKLEEAKAIAQGTPSAPAAAEPSSGHSEPTPQGQASSGPSPSALSLPQGDRLPKARLMSRRPPPPQMDPNEAQPAAALFQFPRPDLPVLESFHMLPTPSGGSDANKKAKKEKKEKKEKKKKKNSEDGSADGERKDSDEKEGAPEPDDDEEDDEDDTQWLTDTSAAAVAARAQEQLSSATASMVTIGNLEQEEEERKKAEKEARKARKAAEKEEKKARQKMADLSMDGDDEESDDDDDIDIPAFREFVLSRPPAEAAKALRKMEVPGGLLGTMRLLWEVVLGADEGPLSSRIPGRKDYIAACVGEDAMSQLALLAGLEHFVSVVSPDQLPEVAKVLKILYDEDLAEEEVILAWNKKTNLAEPLGVQAEQAASCRKAAERVIMWLEEADEQ